MFSRALPVRAFLALLYSATTATLPPLELGRGRKPTADGFGLDHTTALGLAC
jgi:hypothetical protein